MILFFFLSFSPQAQYIFAHDALVEILNTGKTDINIEQLEDRMAELEVENEEGETGYHHEFQVSHYTS